MGAHPGGLFVRQLPVDPYGEDLEFWTTVRDASRSDEFDEWIRHWVLEPADQADYLARLGPERRARLAARAATDSWKQDQADHPPDLTAPVGPWELAATFGARYLAERIKETRAHAVLAGAGVANLAAWLGVDLARSAGSAVELVAELGLYGYEPTPADPFIFNHRSFPSATMLADADAVLGTMVGSPGTRLLGCLGAAQIDRSANINSTVIPGRTFLVGSGGGNDVATRADEVVVVTTLTPRRTVPEVPYITSPGSRVRALVTDLGIFEKDGSGELRLSALAPGPEALDERVRHISALCAWPLEVQTNLVELDPPGSPDIEALRRWDPEGLFLRAG